MKAMEPTRPIRRRCPPPHHPEASANSLNLGDVGQSSQLESVGHLSQLADVRRLDKRERVMPLCQVVSLQTFGGPAQLEDVEQRPNFATRWDEPFQPESVGQPHAARSLQPTHLIYMEDVGQLALRPDVGDLSLQRGGRFPTFPT